MAATPEVLTFTSSSASETAVQLSWTTSGTYIEASVQYRVHGTAAWSTPLIYATGVNSATISGLVAGTEYDFQIQLVALTGNVIGVAQKTVAKPAAPATLTVEVTSGKFLVKSYPGNTTGFHFAADEGVTGEGNTRPEYFDVSIAEATKGITSKWAALPYLSCQATPNTEWSKRLSAPLASSTPPAEKTTPPAEKPTGVTSATHRFGTAVTAELMKEAAFKAFAKEWINIVVPRWQGKWAPMVGDKGAAVTEIAKIAAELGIGFKHHCGVWYQELPAGLPTERAAMEAAVAARMVECVTLPGVIQFDAFNEMLNEDGTPRQFSVLAPFGYTREGLLALLRVGLKAARAANPKCELGLNDYGYLEWPNAAKNKSNLEIATILHNEGLLDYVGDQYHPPNIAGQPSQAEVTARVAEYTKVGLKYKFSEIALDNAGTPQWSNLIVGGAAADEFLVWGPRDQDWDEGDAMHAMPFNDDYTPKTAITNLIEAWLGITVPAEKVTPPVEKAPEKVETPPVNPAVNTVTCVQINNAGGQYDWENAAAVGFEVGRLEAGEANYNLAAACTYAANVKMKVLWIVQPEGSKYSLAKFISEWKALSAAQKAAVYGVCLGNENWEGGSTAGPQLGGKVMGEGFISCMKEAKAAGITFPIGCQAQIAKNEETSFMKNLLSVNHAELKAAFENNGFLDIHGYGTWMTIPLATPNTFGSLKDVNGSEWCSNRWLEAESFVQKELGIDVPVFISEIGMGNNNEGGWGNEKTTDQEIAEYVQHLWQATAQYKSGKLSAALAAGVPTGLVPKLAGVSYYALYAWGDKGYGMYTGAASNPGNAKRTQAKIYELQVAGVAEVKAA